MKTRNEIRWRFVNGMVLVCGLCAATGLFAQQGGDAPNAPGKPDATSSSTWAGVWVFDLHHIDRVYPSFISKGPRSLPEVEQHLQASVVDGTVLMDVRSDGTGLWQSQGRFVDFTWKSED